MTVNRGERGTTGGSRRLRREFRTAEVMIAIHCRAHHSGKKGVLCSECEELRGYVARRVECCPFREKKPTCARCVVHCYKPEMREKIREVMRYAGPGMVWRHPLLALMHLLDGRKPPPAGK